MSQNIGSRPRPCISVSVCVLVCWCVSPRVYVCVCVCVCVCVSVCVCFDFVLLVCLLLRHNVCVIFNVFTPSTHSFSISAVILIVTPLAPRLCSNYDSDRAGKGCNNCQDGQVQGAGFSPLFCLQLHRRAGKRHR